MLLCDRFQTIQERQNKNWARVGSTRLETHHSWATEKPVSNYVQSVKNYYALGHGHGGVFKSSGNYVIL